MAAHPRTALYGIGFIGKGVAKLADEWGWPIVAAYNRASDKPFINDAYEGWTTAAAMAAMMSQPIDWLEGGVVPRRQLCIVMFRNFVQDPIAVVRQVYDIFGRYQRYFGVPDEV